MIRAGALRHAAVLCSVDKTSRDKSGQLRKEYREIKSFRCDILTSKQVQQRIASGMEYPKATTFHCRFMPGTKVTPDMAVLFKGTYYDIQQVENPKGLDIELYIIAEQKL